MTDDTIHQFIVFAGADTLLSKLGEYQYWDGMKGHNPYTHTENQFSLLKKKYGEQMTTFIERIQNHPTVEFQAKKKNE